MGIEGNRCSVSTWGGYAASWDKRRKTNLVTVKAKCKIMVRIYLFYTGVAILYRALIFAGFYSVR